MRISYIFYIIFVIFLVNSCGSSKSTSSSYNSNYSSNKSTNTDYNSANRYSTERFRDLKAMFVNFIVSIIVMKFTPEPPNEIKRIVERIRIPSE